MIEEKNFEADAAIEGKKDLLHDLFPMDIKKPKNSDGYILNKIFLSSKNF